MKKAPPVVVHTVAPLNDVGAPETAPPFETEDVPGALTELGIPPAATAPIPGAVAEMTFTEVVASVTLEPAPVFPEHSVVVTPLEVTLDIPVAVLLVLMLKAAAAGPAGNPAAVVASMRTPVRMIVPLVPWMCPPDPPHALDNALRLPALAQGMVMSTVPAGALIAAIEAP